MNHLYIYHFAGCAVSFDKDTFHSDLWVDFVDIHDTRTGQQQVVKEGQSCRVLQAVISPFIAMSLDFNNQHAKKRENREKLVTCSPYCHASLTGRHGGW